MKTSERLKNLFVLNSKITVYVPSTTDINKEVDNTAYIDGIASLFADCFGGATSCQTLGYWTSPVVGLVRERSTMVFAYCTDSQLQEHIEAVIDYCETMKTELKQEAIALEINGEMYFI